MKLKLLPALSLAIASLANANNLYNKQLAGPPEEFDLMRPVQPEQTAITSKTALIPVSLTETKSGNWYWDSQLAVDDSNFELLVFSNGSKNWQIELVDPVTKQVHVAEDIARDRSFNKYGMDRNNYPADKYDFQNVNKGHWNLRIRTIGEPEQFDGYVLLSSESKYKLNSYKTNLDQIKGHNIHFVTQSTTNEDTIEALKDFKPISSATMVVTHPNGLKSTYEMFDDGLHGDLNANDGLFGGDFKAELAGDYNVQIKAMGTNPDGSPFFRTTEHYVPVIEQSIALNATKASAFTINDNRLNISLNVQNNSKSLDNRYRIIAEVWGNNDKGVMTPVSWVSTITTVVKDQLNVELDGRWLAMAKAQGSFELRNLRIEDANHFIPLVSSDSMEMKVATLPKSATKSFNGQITEEMLMGQRPVMKSNTKAGGKLLLVHGYCSSDVWGPRQSQFSNSAVFYDLNQNRSHDAFAQRIRDFGAQFSSFGIVAHSQGGAASLHLYTYYWSGLDYSTGSRMIQSVGTPYQGTPLAGNLAALGDVFGVGCGTNSNLTTSGASSWLSGIPTWARNEVHYYTTSFETKWWRYDYCSMGTDVFLSDPEDGVIEKSRGQLSGGNNKGHKTGWCHSSDMRDPAQTADSSRNSTMSSYAKR
ncbi:MAG TPA: conditioned medium factor [Gammaproteobacteria bacterium]|jgi:hypothetical protein|nr:conditioned medium factor [Xanthomonadales bacterium]HPI96400.1 conditioned medium factor [Gammaproteobacteria bacterium]HPQ88172.1 conditioned medium factor [Gammaproteobacteria bacterium]